MKEIVILLVTFLGICKVGAQNPAGIIVVDSLKTTAQKMSGDTLLIKENATVKLFPNPAKNKVVLEVKAFEPGLIQLQIIDISGNKLSDDQRLLITGNEHIVIMFSLRPGIYFILLKQKDKTVKKKMMVQ